MKRESMTTNMTYESLLDTFDSFEAYLPFVTKNFDDDLWLKTRTENTTLAYELYLSTLPNGIHKQEATANINKIKRQQEEKAEQEKQEAQRQRELEEQRKKEQAIADDKTAYERAKRTNSKAAYEKYLKNFANGAYRNEAKAKVDHFRKLEQEEQARIQQQREVEAQRQKEQAIANDHQAYESAKRTNTKPAYESYLRGYPYGLHKTEATSKLNEFLGVERALAAQHQQELATQQTKAQSEYEDHQAFEEAKRINTRASYTDYLTFFPSGIHKYECEKRLEINYDFFGNPISEKAREYLKKCYHYGGTSYIHFVEEQTTFKTKVLLAIISENRIDTYYIEYSIFRRNSKIFSKHLYDLMGHYTTAILKILSTPYPAFSSIPMNQKLKDSFYNAIVNKFNNLCFNYKFRKNLEGVNIFIEKGFYGLMKNDKIIVNPTFQYITEYNKYTHSKPYYYFDYSNEIGHGLINNKGNIVFHTDDEYIIKERAYVDIGALIIKKSSQYGIVNLETGKIVIHTEYDNIEKLDGLHKKHWIPDNIDKNDGNTNFLVEKGMKCGVVNLHGEEVVQIKFRFR